MMEPERICRKCDTLSPQGAGFCNMCHAPFPPPITGAGPESSSASAMNNADPLGNPGVSAFSGGGGTSGEASKTSSMRAAPMLFFKDAEQQNVRLSIILFVSMFALFALLGIGIGEFFGDALAGVGLAAILYVILAGTAFFNGSKIVLSFHEAAKADPVKHQQLLNIVEEMSIASGLLPPKVYVMPVDGMNAFAAGRNPKDAVVAVTQGLLDNLNREELQGVIAHEMAHIKSRDTMFNIHIAVLVGAIFLISNAFLRGSALRGGRRMRSSGGSGKAQLIIMVLALLLAVLAPLAAKILQMSISRQREYLADAAAAGFTRNPLGLASALSKISGGNVEVPGENKGTQHMFIINPLSKLNETKSDLMATHPPTPLRIKRLQAMAGLAQG